MGDAVFDPCRKGVDQAGASVVVWRKGVTGAVPRSEAWWGATSCQCFTPKSCWEKLSYIQAPHMTQAEGL
jgi:hypothetical protein